jgi:hypothetical protein
MAASRHGLLLLLLLLPHLLLRLLVVAVWCWGAHPCCSDSCEQW